MSIFPQKETFEYYPETKDKYGNITFKGKKTDL
jgi:hypothetical protein